MNTEDSTRYAPGICCRLRCGCIGSASFWDDPPSYFYEIVWCRECDATWAFAYDEKEGNVEVPL